MSKHERLRLHLAWSEEINALALRAIAVIQAQNINIAPRSLYFYRQGAYHLNLSNTMQYVLERLATEADLVPREQWIQYAQRFKAMPAASQLPGRMLLLEETPFDMIGDVLAQWDWKAHKLVILARKNPKRAYRKLPIMVFALLWFIDQYAD